MDQELKELLLSMQSEMKELRADMNLRFDQADQRMTKIEITLENDIATRLNLLTEGQSGMNEQLKKLDDVAARVEDIQITVNALESATKDNTSQIRELRAIK